MTELWKQIPSCPKYEVSSSGRVRRAGGKVLVPWERLDGRLEVKMRDVSWRRLNRKVHTLVMEAFVGPRPCDQTQVCHNNGDCKDNRVENLRYGSCQENADDRRVHGTLNRGSRNGIAKLNEQKVATIAWMLRSGVKIVAIARVFGVHRETVGSIWRGVNWGHLTGFVRCIGVAQP